jgi:hypothetical protein
VTPEKLSNAKRPSGTPVRVAVSSLLSSKDPVTDVPVTTTFTSYGCPGITDGCASASVVGSPPSTRTMRAGT